MPKEMSSKKFRAPSRDTIASIVLMTNAFVWYFFISEMLKDIVTVIQVDQLTALSIWGAHFGGMAFSAIIGAALAKKLKNRMAFLAIWMVFGVTTSLTSIMMDL